MNNRIGVDPLPRRSRRRSSENAVGRRQGRPVWRHYRLDDRLRLAWRGWPRRFCLLRRCQHYLASRSPQVSFGEVVCSQRQRWGQINCRGSVWTRLGFQAVLVDQLIKSQLMNWSNFSLNNWSNFSLINWSNFSLINWSNYSLVNWSYFSWCIVQISVDELTNCQLMNCAKFKLMNWSNLSWWIDQISVNKLIKLKIFKIDQISANELIELIKMIEFLLIKLIKFQLIKLIKYQLIKLIKFQLIKLIKFQLIKLIKFQLMKSDRISVYELIRSKLMNIHSNLIDLSSWIDTITVDEWIKFQLMKSHLMNWSDHSG